QRLRQGDREFSNQLRIDMTIRFGAGDSIAWTLTPTASSARGSQQGAVRAGTATLGQTEKGLRAVDGDGVGLVENGTLTRLRAFAEAGGSKRTITPEARAGSLAQRR